jgi:glycosyltransferase involved in cell wall biosynthesis
MGNSPWVGTGYGVPGGKIMPYLKSRPEVDDVAHFCYYGLQGNLTRLQVGKYWIDCYPMATDPHGNDIIADWMRDFNANVLITMLDVFITKPEFGCEGFYWLPYAPVDHDPIPQVIAHRFGNAYKPIVYSRFAVEECKKAGIDVWYAPIGVETDIFKPRNKAHKAKAREWLNLKPDTFVVGAVAANKDPMDRKGFQDIFEAFSQLLQKHPDSELYIHTLFSSEFGGWDLMNMAKLYGVADQTRFTSRTQFFRGFSREELANVYQAFDVFINPCHRAGFEVPLIESQASGVPIIAGDWHSMTELMGSGWLIEKERRLWSPVGGWMWQASIPSLVDCLMSAYEEKGNPKIALNARDFAMEYDWQRVLRQHWGTIVDALASELTIRTQPVITDAVIAALTEEAEVVSV